MPPPPGPKFASGGFRKFKELVQQPLAVGWLLTLVPPGGRFFFALMREALARQ